MSSARPKMLLLMVALLLGALAGAAAGALYLYRDRFLDLGRGKAAGRIETEVDQGLYAAAVAYAEKKIKPADAHCVHRWLAKDDRFVYLAFGCAKFALQFGQVHAYGDQGFRALRLRYWWGKWILELDQADPDRLSASLRYLYPPEVNDLWWKRSAPQEYLQEGAKFSVTP